MDSSGGGFRALMARLRSAPPWVWISILIAAAVLVVSWLIYRNQATANANGTNPAGQGTVPADGTGQPLWSTADTSGMITGNVTDLANLLAYLQSQATPNPPNVAPPGGGTIIGPPRLTPGPGGVNGGNPFNPINGPILPPRGVNPPVTTPAGTGGTTPTPPAGTGTPAATPQYFTITQNYSSANRATTTLSGIAGLYHTTVARLLALNPKITNPNLVYKGEQIRVK